MDRQSEDVEARREREAEPAGLPDVPDVKARQGAQPTSLNPEVQDQVDFANAQAQGQQDGANEEARDLSEFKRQPYAERDIRSLPINATSFYFTGAFVTFLSLGTVTAIFFSSRQLIEPKPNPESDFILVVFGTLLQMRTYWWTATVATVTILAPAVGLWHLFRSDPKNKDQVINQLQRWNDTAQDAANLSGAVVSSHSDHHGPNNGDAREPR